MYVYTAVGADHVRPCESPEFLVPSAGTLVQGCVYTCFRVGVKCPHIWVFGKIAYLLYPRPTMTTRLVQSKQPTYLPPLAYPQFQPLWAASTHAPQKHPKSNMPATLPTPPYKRAAHPGLKKNAYLPTPPLPTPNVGALHPYPGGCTQPSPQNMPPGTRSVMRAAPASSAAPDLGPDPAVFADFFDQLGRGSSRRPHRQSAGALSLFALPSDQLHGVGAAD